MEVTQALAAFAGGLEFDALPEKVRSLLDLLRAPPRRVRAA
jgi:hypothetical protein